MTWLHRCTGLFPCISIIAGTIDDDDDQNYANRNEDVSSFVLQYTDYINMKLPQAEANYCRIVHPILLRLIAL